MKMLSVKDIQALVKKVGMHDFFQGLIAQLASDFARWQQFQKVPRQVTHVDQGVIELMPICDDEYYAYKYVNGHAANPQQGCLTVVATGMLAEVQTGYPLLVTEMTLLTAFRTAATAALAARYLAPTKAKKLAIIGTGAQSEFQILAHQVALGIEQVSYFDISAAAMDKFSKNLSSFSLDLQKGNDISTAVADADVVITATVPGKSEIILHKQWLKNKVHINAIGGDTPGKTELESKILQDAKIVVEFLPQTQVEGEIRNLPQVNVYAELWEIIHKDKAGREEADQITVFDSVGFALEDYSILRYVYRLAQQYNIGDECDLIPALDNPRDLFSLVTD